MALVDRFGRQLQPLESLKTPKKRNSGDSGGEIALSEALLLQLRG